MIPVFPEFKKLELSDKDEVESYTKQFAPYSNFNFNSTWAWDIKNSNELSKLNDNLVFKFYDFLSGKHYYSFIGTNKVHETAECLLNCHLNGAEPGILKYVPEETALLLKDSFNVILDEGNCDYILSVDEMANMDKWTNRNGKRGRLCRQFLKLYDKGNIHLRIEKMCETEKSELKKIFHLWAVQKQIDISVFPEYKAFERYCQLTDEKIEVLTVYDNDEIIGFQIHELISDGIAMIEFTKYKKNFRGICQFIDWKTGKHLLSIGIKNANAQVDMGDFSLHFSKSQCHPAFLLNSYCVFPQKNEKN